MSLVGSMKKLKALSYVDGILTQKLLLTFSGNMDSSNDLMKNYLVSASKAKNSKGTISQMIHNENAKKS